MRLRVSLALISHLRITSQVGGTDSGFCRPLGRCERRVFALLGVSVITDSVVTTVLYYHRIGDMSTPNFQKFFELLTSNAETVAAQGSADLKKFFAVGIMSYHVLPAIL